MKAWTASRHRRGINIAVFVPDRCVLHRWLGNHRKICGDGRLLCLYRFEHSLPNRWKRNSRRKRGRFFQFGAKGTIADGHKLDGGVISQQRSAVPSPCCFSRRSLRPQSPVNLCSRLALPASGAKGTRQREKAPWQLLYFLPLPQGQS